MAEIGVLGDAGLARAYALQCRERDGVELVAVDGTSAAVAGRTVTTYDSVDALCANAPATVILCTPLSDRRSTIAQLCQSGCEIVCPGPIADTGEKITAIGSMVADSPGRLVSIADHRVSPPASTAAERVRTGAIGTVGTVRTFRQFVAGNLLTRGAPLADLAFGVVFHELDLCRWLCGPIERVFARTVSGARLTAAIVTLRCGSAVGHIEARLTDRSAFDPSHRFELAGDGHLSYDSQTDTPVTTTPSHAEPPTGTHRLGPEMVLRSLCADGGDRFSFERSIESSITTLRATRAVLESIDREVPVTVGCPE
ncbi:Gfo/Idh/MocA family oxidoreductase [Halocatena halophila]|uniref:hypothetical protein n=1 Tax=Halocatena halophila TaxID=2814576 RepID=UPI002ED0927C